MHLVKNANDMLTTSNTEAIQLMEEWRCVEELRHKRLFLLLSSVSLGGCAIWCMHFTGMTALSLQFDIGIEVEIDYELSFTALSLAFAVVGVFIELKIASIDPFFWEMEAQHRQNMLVRELMKSLRKSCHSHSSCFSQHPGFQSKKC